MIWADLGFTLLKIGLVLFIVLTLVAYLTLAERKISAFMQDRIGPNRVGPFGFLQPLADGIKFIFKEDIIPDQVNRRFFCNCPRYIVCNGYCGACCNSHRKRLLYYFFWSFIPAA